MPPAGTQGCSPHPDFPLHQVHFSLAKLYLGKWFPQSFTWVNGSPDDPAQGVPRSVIKPVVEFVEALLSQEAGGAVVEIPVRVTGCDSTVGAAHVFHAQRTGPVSLSCSKSQLQSPLLLPVGLIVCLQR